MCAQKGVPLRIAIPAAGVQIVLYGIPKNAPIACFAGCIAPIHLSEVKDGQMTGIDLFHCKGCGVCVQECKFGALELFPKLRLRKRKGSK